MERIDWAAGHWNNPPRQVGTDGDDLLVAAVEGSDAWCHTSYGFVHDTEHGLLAPLAVEHAVEVVLVADFSAQFDQAGVLLRADGEHWVKAGCEYADGRLQVGAVVTDGRSDWSVGRLAGEGRAGARVVER